MLELCRSTNKNTSSFIRNQNSGGEKNYNSKAGMKE